MNGCFLGIDTSNYTTSAAICDMDGKIIENLKIPLEVKRGERGLRQSDAVFAHTKNLPELFCKIRKIAEKEDFTFLATGVSVRPRNVEGSYMPCFLSGITAAEAFSAGAHIPLYRFSHQCGHIAAAIYSSAAKNLSDKPFAAFHVSGGTTEALITEKIHGGFKTVIFGASLDISAGQAIDRIGVALGLNFPCGNELEILAAEFEGDIAPYRRSISAVYGNCNLSGLENLAQKVFKETNDKLCTAAFVFDYIGRTLEAMCRAVIEKYGNIPVLFAGGVMSNKLIRKHLSAFDSYFCEPEYAADNAAGIALLAYKAFNSK